MGHFGSRSVVTRKPAKTNSTSHAQGSGKQEPLMIVCRPEIYDSRDPRPREKLIRHKLKRRGRMGVPTRVRSTE